MSRLEEEGLFAAGGQEDDGRSFDGFDAGDGEDGKDDADEEFADDDFDEEDLELFDEDDFDDEDALSDEDLDDLDEDDAPVSLSAEDEDLEFGEDELFEMMQALDARNEAMARAIAESLGAVVETLVKKGAVSREDAHALARSLDAKAAAAGDGEEEAYAGALAAFAAFFKSALPD